MSFVPLSAKPKKSSRSPGRMPTPQGLPFGGTQAPSKFGYSPATGPGTSMMVPTPKIGNPSDSAERQAHTVADQIMQMSARDASGGPARNSPVLAATTLGQDITLTPLSSLMSDAVRNEAQREFGGTKIAGTSVASGHSVDQAAQSMHADAFTIDGQIHAASSTLNTTNTAARDHLLIHELVHTGQPTPSSVVRRGSLDFGDGTGDYTYGILESDGTVTQSDTLRNEFIAGAFQYLGLKYDDEEAESNTAMTHAVVQSHFEDVASSNRRSLFLRSFPMKIDLDLPNASSPVMDLDKVSTTISVEQAGKIFDEFVNLVKKNNYTMRALHDRRQISGVQTNDFGRIRIGDGYKDMIVDREYQNAWNGFWILLHEMYHRAGLDVAQEVYQGFEYGENEWVVDDKDDDAKKYQTSPQMLAHDNNIPAAKILTMPAPVESGVNILRAGFGLPVRINYSDVGANDILKVYFGKKPTSYSKHFETGVAMTLDLNSYENEDARTIAEVEHARDSMHVKDLASYEKLWKQWSDHSPAKLVQKIGETDFISTIFRQTWYSDRRFFAQVKYELSGNTHDLQMNGYWSASADAEAAISDVPHRKSLYEHPREGRTWRLWGLPNVSLYVDWMERWRDNSSNATQDAEGYNKRVEGSGTFGLEQPFYNVIDRRDANGDGGSSCDGYFPRGQIVGEWTPNNGSGGAWSIEYDQRPRLSLEGATRIEDWNGDCPT